LDLLEFIGVAELREGELAFDRNECIDECLTALTEGFGYQRLSALAR
jgi:hypothetical protein